MLHTHSSLLFYSLAGEPQSCLCGVRLSNTLILKNVWLIILYFSFCVLCHMLAAAVFISKHLLVCETRLPCLLLFFQGDAADNCFVRFYIHIYICVCGCVCFHIEGRVFRALRVNLVPTQDPKGVHYVPTE